MKYKSIDIEYLTLCLDRLTRFKPSFDKYFRVFNDILNKFDLTHADKKSCEETAKAACAIFNDSVSEFNNKKYDKFFNHLLQKEERHTFFQNSQSETLICSPLNIEGLLDVIKNKKNLPLNLKRLVEILKNKEKDPVTLRKELALKYPLEKIVLTEGITEEILLGEFAKKINYDFDKNGIHLIGAGGKNQVAKKYYKMVEEIKLPIFVLLDYDAAHTKDLILPKLRKDDFIYVIDHGEFEDIIPKKLILDTINNHFKNSAAVSEKDFTKNVATVKNLKEIYRINGLGHFNKADFAKNIRANLAKKDQISKELSEIIEKIKNL